MTMGFDITLRRFNAGTRTRGAAYGVFPYPIEAAALVFFGLTDDGPWMQHYIFDGPEYGLLFDGGAVADRQLIIALVLFDHADRPATAASEMATIEAETLRFLPYEISSAASVVFGRDPSGEWHHHIFWPYSNAIGDYAAGPVTDRVLITFLDNNAGKFLTVPQL
jgi:hypothetical protein